MLDFERLRLGMVDCQIRVADVTDHRVLAAFLETPREEFVPEARREIAYLDTRVPLGGGRAMLDPMTQAKLTQLAGARATDRVLVVGAGGGYSAAIFSKLAASVVALESSADLAAAARAALGGYANVTVVEGPLPAGAPADAPYDVIFCDGSIAVAPDALAAQLAPNGRLIAPSGSGRATKATVFRRSGDATVASPAFDAAGPLLPGFEPVATFAL